MPDILRPQELKALDVALKYLTFLDRVYGMYSDCCSGVEIYADKIAIGTAGSRPGSRILYSDSNPNEPGAMAHHITTPSEVKHRNRPDGPHQQMLSKSCIVFVYSVWDEQIRQPLSEACGLAKGDFIKSDIFGDLRHYRNSIAHGGKLKRQTVALKFVKMGEEVALTRKQMKALFVTLFEALNCILLEHTGIDHGFKFERVRP